MEQIEKVEKAIRTPSELPNGWTKAPLVEIADIIMGQSPSSEYYNADRDGLPFFQGKAEFGDLYPEPVKWCSQPSKVAQKDDILISVRAPVGPTNLAPSECCIGRGLAAIRPRDGIPSKYLLYYLRNIEGSLDALGTGTTFKAISGKVLHAIPVPVAPPDQQKRIVAEIEKQFSRLDEAVANLKRVKANLKRYKAAVLKAAVEGKLTAEWRKAHLPAPTSRPGKFYTYALLCSNDSIYIGHTDDIERRWKAHCEGRAAEWTKEHKPVKIAHYEEYDTREEAADREKWLKTGYGRKWIKRELAAGRTRQAGDVEPASELLKRILAERRAKWEKQARSGRRNSYIEPKPPETYDLPRLPAGWVWASCEQICDFITKGTTPAASKLREGKGEIRFLKVYNLTFTGLLDYNRKPTFVDRVVHEGELARSKVQAGDVLINIVGPPLGQVSVVPPEIGEANINQAIARLRPLEGVLSKFLMLVLMAEAIMSWAISRAKTTAGQANLTLELCRELPVPVLPLAEQNRLVGEVDRRLSITAGIETQVDLNLKRVERLRHSILAHSFGGKMKPYDSIYSHGQKDSAGGIL